MAVITVPSSVQGKSYNVRIAGDAPTPEEQSKIEAYVSQMDSVYGQGGGAAAEPEPTGGVGSALGVGVDMLQRAYGSAIEGAGSSLGLESLRDYGKSVADFNSQQIQEATPGLTGYEDVNSIGSGLSYFGETLAKQVPQLGVSLAGAGAGALTGSAFGPVGTGIGAIAGGALANLPFFYGSNRERQKEADVAAGRPVQVDEGTAFLSAIPQATIDAIVDRMLVSKLLKPAMIGSGNILLRTVKGAGAGIAAEVPSEIGQQMIERYQAGLPLDDDEALAEYAAVARETAIVGGTVGSVSNVAGGDSRVREQKKKDEEAARQIEEDQAEDAKDIMDKIGFGQKAMEPPVEEEAPPAIAGLLPPPTIGSPAPTAPPTADDAPAAPKATSGIQLDGVDEAIANGVSNLKVSEDGKEVPFKTFALSVDGDRAEVGFVEKRQGTRKGIGRDAYVALGNDLSGRGITLQSTETLLKDGNALWKGLEKSGNATYNATTKRFEFKPNAAPQAAGTPQTVPAPSGQAPVAPRPGSYEAAVADGLPPVPPHLLARRATPAAPAPTFMWKQYQAVLQNIGKEKAPTILAIQNAAKAAGTPVTPAVARDILSQMERDGVVTPNAKVKGGYKYQPNVVPQVDRAESYRRTLQDLTREAAEARTAREKAVLDARKAQQTGKAADARKLMLEVDKADQTLAGIERNMQEVSSRLPNVQQEQAVPTTQQPGSRMEGRQTFAPITEAPPAVQSKAVTARSQRLRQAMSYYQDQARRQGVELRRLQADQKKVQLPKSEIKRMEDLKASIAEATRNVQQIGKRLANPTEDIEANVAQQKADAAKQAAAVAERANKTPIYSQREGQIFTALRKRLSNLGLSDVQLVAEKMLKPEQAKQGALYEGLFDVKDGNRVIAVAMGIYDPNMTPQQQFDALAEVMNHEVIHALKNLGLFTDAEWKTLSDLAARQQFVKVKNGKTTQRSYTYLQRAKQMYAQESADIQVEEAIAEMFRDYVAGRLKIGGRPRTLMERIKGFFTSIWKSHQDVGMTDPNQIFEGVRFGEIGKRDRKVENRATPVSPNDADTERQSRIIVERAASDPDFQRWASGPKGEKVITDESGNPQVFYTGTSKDQDFTKFKIGRHGGWFTTDPSVASSYAEENDSMGMKQDGWTYTRTNTASRVMPVFLRSANPYTGPLPVSALAQNYKKAQSDWFDSLRAKGYDMWLPSDQPGLAVPLKDGTQIKSVFAKGSDGKDDMRRYSMRSAEPIPETPTEERLSVLRTKNRSTELIRGIDELVQYAEDQVSWRDWYDRYQSVLDDLFGDDSELFRSILSATSQAASVPANVGLAIKAYDQMMSGQEFTGFLPAVIKNLNRIRAEEALAGRKIGEYGKANEGDDEGIAVDRHIAMIMFDTINPSAQQVEAGKAAIRVIAERLGWKPREVQAALWAANIKRMGKEPQSYDTFLLRKADQIRQLREKFPAKLVGRDGRGAGTGGGADVGTEKDGPRYSVKYVADVGGTPVPLTDGDMDALNAPIEETIEDTTNIIKQSGGFVLTADQVEGMIDTNDIPVVTAQQMIGMKIIPTIADRTAAGFFYTGIDGAGVHMVIPMLGGPRFPYRITNAERGIIWSNRGKGVITDIEQKIAEGATHILVVLGDANMHVSNTTVSNAFFGTLEAYVESGRITPENAAALTEMVRSSKEKNKVTKAYLEKFPGFSDIDALDDYLHSLSFEARKRMLKIFGSKAARSLGSPNMTKVLRATRDKEMSSQRWGDGVILLELDKKRPTIKLGEEGSAPHPDFPLGVRGRVVGRLPSPVSYEVLWSKWVNKWKKDKAAAYDFMASPEWRAIPTWDGRTSATDKALKDNVLNKEQHALVMADINASLPVKATKRSEAFEGVEPQEFDEAVLDRDDFLSRLNPRRAFELSKPMLDFGAAEAAEVGEIRQIPIDGYTQARLAADFVAGNWRRSTGKKTKGGVSVQGFLDAVEDSDYSVTLTKFNLKEVRKDISSGKTLISQLGDGEIYYGMKRGMDYEAEYGFSHPDLTKNETAIVGVVNNEQGARGIGGPAIMLDAISNGATALDCFNVKTAKFPNGFLPTYYKEFGFEVLGEIPFDPKQFTDIQLSDLKAVWKRDGWEEDDGYPSLAIMKWRGTDADRKGITSRYLRGGTQGLLAGRVGADAAAEAADISFQRSAETGGGAGVGGGTERASPTGGQRSVASRLRETALYLAALNDAEVGNLGINASDRDEARAAFTENRDSAFEWKRRASVRYSTSAITPAMGKKVLSNQNALMYAKSSDLIAKALNLGGYGMEEKAARDFSDGILRRFQDSMIPIGRMVQELSQAGMTIIDAMDPYLQEALMHGVVGRRIEVNRKDMYDPLLQAVKGLNVPKARIDALVTATDVASAKGKGFLGLALERYKSPRLAVAEAFLYARHAKERNRFIEKNRDIANQTGSGMTDAEADAILSWVRGLDDANKGLLAKIGQQSRMIVENTNRTRVEAGLISEDVAGLDGASVDGADFKFYVPMRGKFGEDADDQFTGPPSSPLFGAKGREDRKMLGRYDYGTDLIANLFSQNQNSILRGERNKVGQSFLNLLRADPTMTSEYASILDRQPTKRVSIDGKMRDMPDPMAAQDPTILIVKENGKQTWVRFTDPGMAGAMNGRNGMSPVSTNIMLKAMRTLNRYLSTINTSYNPEFIVTNGFRDLQTGLLNMNQFEIDGVVSDVIKGLGKAAGGIRDVVRKDNDTSEWAKVYKDYMDAGGQNVTNQFNTLADQANNIKGMLDEISEAGMSGKWGKVKNSFVGKRVGSLISFIEDYNGLVENTIRVSAYKALLDRGFSKQRAAQAARNLTVNFAKGGDYREFMGAWSLFYNASLQGTFALLNAAVRSRRVQKMWLGLIAAGIVQDQLNALLSPEDEDGEKQYDKIPDFVLERNFVLPDLFNLTDRSYISIPMPYGLNMAVNAGRLSSAVWRGAATPGKASSQIIMGVLDTVNPLGGTESFYNFVAPTVADPFIDLAENEDQNNRQIFKEGMPFDKTPEPNSQMYWSTTSPSAIWISNMLNQVTGGNEVRPGFVDWSPDVLEYWFNFATGGIGRFANASIEGTTAVMREGLTPENLRGVVFVRKVVGSVSSREDEGQYIEDSSQVLMAAEELKKARENGDVDWARDTIEEYGDELRLVGPVKAIDAALRKIKMQRNKIADNPNIPESQRSILLDKLDERKQMLLSRANSLLARLEQ